MPKVKRFVKNLKHNKGRMVRGEVIKEGDNFILNKIFDFEILQEGRGGKRARAGRPAGAKNKKPSKVVKTKMRSFRLTDLQYELVKEFVKNLKGKK